MRNAYCHAHGGVSNRPGYYYLGEIKDSPTKTARLFPFQFSTVQAYMLEFGDQYMRVMKDGGRVTETDKNISAATKANPGVITLGLTATITGATQANPCVITTAAAHGFSNGDAVYISGVVGMVELNTNTYYVANKTSTTFELVNSSGTNINSTAYTAYTSGGTVVSAHLYSNGDWVYVSSVAGMTQLNGKIYKVANKTANTFELNTVDGVAVNTSSYTTYTSGGTAARIYTLVTPYVEADLPLLKITQSADTLILTHPSYAPYKITRSAHTSWTIAAITFAPSISAPASFARSAGAGTGHTYAVTAVKANGEESLISGTATGGPGDTFTWTAVADADHYEAYENKNGVYGWLGYAGLNAGSPSFIVPASLDPDMEQAPPTAKTPFASSSNYPGVAAFFQQRLEFARTNNKPQTVFGSVTGSFYNMNIRSPIHDDDSYEFTIDSRQVNEIRWLVPLDSLIIGTSGSEWRMKPAGNAGSVTPSSVDMKVQSEWGVSHIQPLIIGNTVLFIDGSEKQVRDLTYSLEVDGYDGNDLTILANHLFEQNTMTRWCYQKGTDSIVWAVRDDGKLLGMTYHKEHKVWGWHRHDTRGYFEDIASVLNSSGRSDVYAIVRRTVNGSTRRYIEFSASRYFADIRDAFFLDSGLSLDVPITISGATKAAEGVITATSHGLSNGDYVDISDVVGMTQLNLNQYIVSDVTTHTFKLKNINTEAYIDTSAFSTYVSDGYARKAQTTVTGLDHLEGETVSAFANGSVVSNLTVTSGAVSLTSPASRIHVGIPYTQDIETLDFNYFPVQGGTAIDKTRFISAVTLKLKDTRALFVGPPLLYDADGNEDDSRLQELKFRTDERYGDPMRAFTGDYPVPVEQAEDFRSAVLFIRNPYPVPFTILSAIPKVAFGEN
jgi:hypothetical protein